MSKARASASDRTTKANDSDGEHPDYPDYPSSCKVEMEGGIMTGRLDPSPLVLSISVWFSDQI